MIAVSAASAERRVGGHLQISVMGPQGNPAFTAANADIAYDALLNRYMMVWQGTASAVEGPQIHIRRLSAGMSIIGPSRKISNTPGGLPSEDPAIAFNRDADEWLVLWAAKSNAQGATEIHGQRLKPAGDPPSGINDFAVSATGTGADPFDASHPRLAYDPASKSYLAVWRSDDQGDGLYEIYGQRISGTGSLVGEAFRISKMGPAGQQNFGADDPTVAYDSVNHRFMVAWSGDHVVDNEREIYTRLYTGQGAPIGAQRRISHMGPDGDSAFSAFEPSLAFGGGQYLLAWRADAPGQDDHFEGYAQRINAAGEEIGATDVQISQMGPAENPAYGVGAPPEVEYLAVSNRFLVLWSGDKNVSGLVEGEMEVHGQTLGAAGQRLGDAFRITVYGTAGSSATDAEFPRAVYNPIANQTMVVWQGTGFAPLAPTEHEIYSQRVGDDRDGDGKIDGLNDACATVAGGRFDADADGCPDDRDHDKIIDALDQCLAVPGGAVDANRNGCPDDSDADEVIDERDDCPTIPAGRLDPNHNGCGGPYGIVRPRLSQHTRGFAFASYTTITRLRFTDLPKAKVTIRLRCIRRCDITERRVKPAGKRAVSSRKFKGKRLRRGSTITARITSKDLIGKLLTYRLSGKTLELQKVRGRCIPIDSTKARKKCGRGR